MTAVEAKQSAVEARVKAIEEAIASSTSQGLFEMRISTLTAEQKEYLAANGFAVREIEQKGGSTYNINWE